MFKKIFIAALFLVVSVSAYADRNSELESVWVPSNVYLAVDTIYDMGRNEADFGGISSIKHYKNTKKLSHFKILRDIMFYGKKYTSAKGFAETTCEEINKNQCVSLVLKNSEDVRANYGAVNMFYFLDEISDAGFGDRQNEWLASIDIVKEYVKSIVGTKYTAYNYGYDDIADVFVIVMISKDNKDIIVVTGDYGA